MFPKLHLATRNAGFVQGVSRQICSLLKNTNFSIKNNPKAPFLSEKILTTKFKASALIYDNLKALEET